MTRQIQITQQTLPERSTAPVAKAQVLKLAAVAEPPAAVDPAPRGMASQPAPVWANDSVPQKLIRLTGSYNPVTPPDSWRRARRTPDAA